MILSKPSTRAHKHKHQHEHDHQPSRFKVAVTATRALRGVWPQRASMPGGREYTGLRGRDRNRFKIRSAEENAAHCKETRAKAKAKANAKAAEGSANIAQLFGGSVPKTTGSAETRSTAAGSSAAACSTVCPATGDGALARLLAAQFALCYEEVVAAEAAGEEGLEDAMEAALCAEPPVSRGASGSAAGPFSPRPPAASPSSSGAIASSVATAEARSGVNLLALQLEAITALYGSGERGHYEDLQQAYTVNWTAGLGQGVYGKVYVGTK